MKKIMIVEDERVVREKLKQEIRWSEGQVILVGEAENGVEALGIYKKTLPDIIFVDIKMPVMDGIKFTENVKKINPQVKIVLLTAYSDFRYAQEAINLKVEKYMLKYELDGEKINGVMNELLMEIDKENNNESKQAVLRRVLYEKHSDEEMRGMLHRAGIMWGNNPIYMCYVKNAQNHERDSICGMLKKESFEVDYRWISEDAFVLFISEGTVHGGKSRVVIERMALQYQQLLFIDTGKPVLLMSLQNNFFQILKVVNMYLFFENQNLISTDILDLVCPFLYHEELNHIFVYLRERRYDAAIDKIVYLLGEKAVKSYNIEAIEQCLDQLVGGLFEEINRQNSDISHAYVLGVFKRIHACRHIQQIIHIITEEIEKLKRSVNLSRKMCLILNYIDDNYQRDITLEELSEIFNWNPSYLSQTFRKEMKVTFKQYINDLKLKKAKELLLERQLSVEQIAEHVGYANVNYFYKVFKKSTGKKPREYV